jgi:hypothetical protein
MPLRPGGTFGPHPLTATDQSAIPYRTYPYYAKYRKGVDGTTRGESRRLSIPPAEKVMGDELAVQRPR